jgi:hypothetical protein
VRVGAIDSTDVHPYSYLRLEPDVERDAQLGEMDVDLTGRRIFLAQALGR